jgi:hypothetical protein
MTMTRIPSHTIEDAPEASRELLADMVQFSPTGRLLNMHAQMAHAPAVLAAYTSIRRATGQLGLTVFTAYFLNYAGTELDVPASPEPTAAAGPGRA